VGYSVPHKELKSAVNAFVSKGEKAPVANRLWLYQLDFLYF